MEKFSRKAIHFSQQDMADFLEVSISAISMYEAGQRALPPAAKEKLALLEDCLARFLRDGLPEDHGFYEPVPDRAPFKKLLNARVQRASAAAVRYSTRLQKMGMNRRRLGKKQSFIRYLLLQKDACSFSVTVLKKIEQSIKKRLRNCCSVKEEILLFHANSNTILQELATKIIREQG